MGAASNRRVRIAPILRLGAAREYVELDIMRAWVGPGDAVFGARISNHKQLVRVGSDGITLTTIYTFPKNIWSGLQAKNGTLFVGIADFLGAFFDYPGEVWRSTDGGATFTKVLDVPHGCPQYWSWAEDSRGNIYCGVYGYKNGPDGENARYVYKSIDNGATWTICFDSGGPHWSHIHQVLVDPYDDSIWVTVGDNPVKREMWRSADHGQTWTLIANNEAISVIFRSDDILWGTDSNTGEILRMVRGSWSMEPVFTHPSRGQLWDMVEDPTSGNIYAHILDEINSKHYTVIGTPDLKHWRALDYRATWEMSPFAKGRTYCRGYALTAVTTSVVMPTRVP